MAVTGIPTAVPRRDGHDPDALLQRAREAREAARDARAHSRALALRLREWNAGSLRSRCAWCGRYRAGEEWVTVRAAPPAHRTTHSICGDCVTTLREYGLSA